MQLLYVDESGHSADPNQNFFVLAGISVFERQSWWISKELDEIAARFDKDHPELVELHGSPMLQGRGIWKAFPLKDRVQAMLDALSVITDARRKSKIFGAVVSKAAISPHDPVFTTFEELTSRFDKYLLRLYRQTGEPHRGLILFDKTVHEASLQSLARDFRTVGHRWGVLRNLSEVPVFIDSRASRVIQMADLVAYALLRMWEKKDDRFYNVIRDCFDSEGGTTYGLYVKT